MVYQPFGMRRRSWCITHSFSLRRLFWWPIMYVCKFKNYRYQIWTAVLPWKFIGLYVRYNIPGKGTASLAVNVDWSQADEIVRRRLIFYFVNQIMCFVHFWRLNFQGFYIHKIAFSLLTIKQTQLYILLTVFILEIPVL